MRTQYGHECLLVLETWSENYKGGLVVEECKTNCPIVWKYNEMIVAHYFAHSSGITFNRSTESDVGLSVLIKIRVSNGILDLTVEGPEKGGNWCI